MQSIDDVKNEAAFGNAIIDAKNLKNMKQIQAALTDDLANSKIDIDTWTKKDAALEAAVKTIQQRLNQESFNVNTPLVLLRSHGFGAPVEHSFTMGSLVTQQVVRESVQKLSDMGEVYKAVIEISEERLANNYY